MHDGMIHLKLSVSSSLLDYLALPDLVHALIGDLTLAYYPIRKYNGQP